MIQIPIHLLTSLLTSLGNKPIKCIEKDTWDDSPLRACFITNDSSNDSSTHTLILIEVIGLRTITQPVEIKNAYRNDSVSPLFSYDGHCIAWSYKVGTSEGIETWIKKEIDIRQLINYSKDSFSPYEKWLLDFMSAREVFMGMNSTLYSHFKLYHRYYKHHSTSSIDKAHKSILNIIEELESEALLILNNYPYD